MIWMNSVKPILESMDHVELLDKMMKMRMYLDCSWKTYFPVFHIMAFIYRNADFHAVNKSDHTIVIHLWPVLQLYFQVMIDGNDNNLVEELVREDLSDSEYSSDQRHEVNLFMLKPLRFFLPLPSLFFLLFIFTPYCVIQYDYLWKSLSYERTYSKTFR